MANKSKNIGTRIETRIVRYLIPHGLDAKRKVLHGSVDEGDIEVTTPSGLTVTLECKGGKQTAKYSRSQKKKWLNETKVEQDNSGTEAWLVLAIYNKPLHDAEVWSADGHTFYFFDDFVNMLTTI